MKDLSALEKAVRQGSQVLVSAVVVLDRDQTERASGIVVTIEDVENEALTLAEARKQLEAATATLK